MTGFDGRGWFQMASRAAPNTRKLSAKR